MTDTPTYKCAECGAAVHIDEETQVLTRDCGDGHDGKGVILDLGPVVLEGTGGITG